MFEVIEYNEYEMDKRIRAYCKHICKTHIEVLRKDHKTHSKFWDLPAMAVICHDIGRTHFAKEYSHHPAGTKWHSILEMELRRLGNIGKRSCIGKGYVIGNCAEQHAGNNYMKEFHESHLDNLYFTEAVRLPRLQFGQARDNIAFVHGPWARRLSAAYGGIPDEAVCE